MANLAVLSPATEEYPFIPGDDYQRTKLAAVIWLNDSAKKTKLPYTIIKPAAIYGLGNRRLFKLFKMALKAFSLHWEMDYPTKEPRDEPKPVRRKLIREEIDFRAAQRVTGLQLVFTSTEM